MQTFVSTIDCSRQSIQQSIYSNLSSRSFLHYPTDPIPSTFLYRSILSFPVLYEHPDDGSSIPLPAVLLGENRALSPPPPRLPPAHWRGARSRTSGRGVSRRDCRGMEQQHCCCSPPMVPPVVAWWRTATAPFCPPPATRSWWPVATARCRRTIPRRAPRSGRTHRMLRNWVPQQQVIPSNASEASFSATRPRRRTLPTRS